VQKRGFKYASVLPSRGHFEHHHAHTQPASSALHSSQCELMAGWPVCILVMRYDHLDYIY